MMGSFVVIFSLICGAAALPFTQLKPGCLPEDGQPNLFCAGDAGYSCYRIPNLLRTKNGTLLAMVEARKFSCNDQGYVDLRLRRSFDDGRTWGPSLLVHGNSTMTEWITVGDSSMVEDATSGIIWLFHTRNNRHLFLSASRDQGATWSEPKNVTADLKYGHPDTISHIGTGHAGGIQLRNGRLLVPVVTSADYVIYSDDHGESWHIGGAVTLADGEHAVAEMDDGHVIMSIRNSCKFPTSIGCGRLQAYSADGGETWKNLTEVKQLPETIGGCEGSVVYHPGTKKLFFAHIDPKFLLLRNRLVLLSSSDHGHTWDFYMTVWSKAAAYNSMVLMGNGTDAKLGLLYERNNHSMLKWEVQSISLTFIDVYKRVEDTLVI